MILDPLSSISAGDTGPLGSQITTPEQQKLWQTAKAMESVFSSYMLEGIGKNLPGMSSSSGGGEIYGDLFKQAIAQQMANRHSLGLADMIYQKSVGKLDETNATSTGTLK